MGRDHVALTLVAPLKPGDGLVFDAGRPDEKEEGGRVYQVETRGGEYFFIPSLTALRMIAVGIVDPT